MTTVQAPDILRCAYMEIVVTDLEASRKFYVDKAREQGAKILTGGRAATSEDTTGQHGTGETDLGR